MNYAWGYRVEDQWYKPLKDIVALLVKAVSKDANLLLNIGPMASGELPAPALERLQELGAWMREHGHTVNGCGSTGIPPEPWGVFTRDAKHLYIHILDPSALPADGIVKVSLGRRTFYRKVPAVLDPVDTILEILVN
jgi:alpha-L-fucosidase